MAAVAGHPQAIKVGGRRLSNAHAHPPKNSPPKTRAEAPSPPTDNDQHTDYPRPSSNTEEGKKEEKSKREQKKEKKEEQQQNNNNNNNNNGGLNRNDMARREREMADKRTPHRRMSAGQHANASRRDARIAQPGGKIL